MAKLEDQWRKITMRAYKPTNWEGFIFLGVIVLAVTGTAHASVRVGGAALLANGQLAQGNQYTGPCPVDLEFHWGVISSEPTTVTYYFVRSDGGQSSNSQSIYLPNANRSVPIVDHWRLGANNSQFANFSGWIQLEIQSPNPVSYKIPFTIHCAGPTVRVGGAALLANGQLTQGNQYAGSCPVDLEFHWGVLSTGPTTVTYTFVRSDGGRSSNELSIYLPSANRSIPIVDHWKLGNRSPQFANFSGWIQLEIQSPNPISYKIPFTIHCE
jgi:hypothetical protein